MGKLSKAIRASLEALPVEGVEPLNLDAPADELDAMMDSAKKASRQLLQQKIDALGAV